MRFSPRWRPLSGRVILPSMVPHVNGLKLPDWALYKDQRVSATLRMEKSAGLDRPRASVSPSFIDRQSLSRRYSVASMTARIPLAVFSPMPGARFNSSTEAEKMACTDPKWASSFLAPVGPTPANPSIRKAA